MFVFLFHIFCLSLMRRTNLVGLLLVCLIWCLLFVCNCSSELAGPSTIHDRMYTFTKSFPCVLLLNSTSRIGCSMGEKSVQARLFPILTQSDVDSLLVSPPSSSLALVLSAKLFNRENVNRFEELNKIVGLLIINDSAPKGGHSPADRSPNSLWGLYPNNAHEWNVNGDGLNFISLRFPIFALDDEWSEFTLRKAYENIADPSTPQWHADFALPMAANSDQNAHTCLRRSNCDPLGGRNVWSSIESKNQIENQSIMFVSNFDGNAFFHDLATAADVAAAGPAVLLGALDVLSHLPIEFEKKLVFALFTGESWGLIGSRSFVKDIDSFECQQPVVDDRCSQPFRSSMSFSQLSLDRISSVIEVSQIAALSPNAPLYIHPSPNGHSNDQIIKALIESALESGIEIEMSNESQLPATSLTSFIHARANMSGVVLSDFDSQFVNHNFEGFFDSPNRIDVSSLCRASDLIIRTAIKLAAPNVSFDDPTLALALKSDCLFISSVFDCLASQNNCSLAAQYEPISKYDTEPVTSYVGVYQRSWVSLRAKLLFDWMADLTAKQRTDVNCSRNSDCQTDFICIASKCVGDVSAHYHDALSPAFELDGRHWKIVDDSQPTWVESRWPGMAVKIFRTNSSTADLFVLIAGLIEVLLCIAVIFVFTNRHSIETKQTNE